MKTTNKIVQVSDAVRDPILVWVNSKLQKNDLGAKEWQVRADLHGKMVLLGRAKAALPPSRPGDDPDFDAGVRLTITELGIAKAILIQMLRKTLAANWQPEPKLDRIWTQRQIRTLRSIVALVVKAQFICAAFADRIKMPHLVSCVRLLCQLAEFLPEPAQELIEFLSATPDSVRSAYFPWIDREVVEVLAQGDANEMGAATSHEA